MTPESESCEELIIPLDSVITRDYKINILDRVNLPYYRWELASFDDYTQDKAGVILFEWEGNTYYNSTQISQKMLQFLQSYDRTKDVKYINETKKFAEKMVSRAIVQDSAFYFPFDFNWHLKERVLELEPPWYCGMAQGQALSAFIRLYDASKDDRYLKLANKIQKSLTLIKGNYDPWVIYIDQERYYWIEEYPEECPNHVLNGFIFALFGLYDHYRFTNDSTSLHLLKAGITTVVDHIEGWRKPGDISKYTYKYHITSGFYHTVHVKLLEKLFQITDDPFFKEMADAFRSDYWE
ncbi:hypothetical protein JXQ31_02810 [candidate division KSB1 bacterium]|nr:hypothetical protein [candidate division KSB1 bacterium]